MKKKNIFDVGVGNKHKTNFKELVFDKSQFDIPEKFTVLKGSLFAPENKENVAQKTVDCNLDVVGANTFETMYSVLNKAGQTDDDILAMLLTQSIRISIKDYQGNDFKPADVQFKTIKLKDFEIVPLWTKEHSVGAYRGVKISAKGFDFDE